MRWNIRPESYSNGVEDRIASAHQEKTPNMNRIVRAALTAALTAGLAVPVAAGEQPAKASAAEAVPADRSAQVVYQVLLAEIALQRGQLELATAAYANLALKTRDPKVLERTVEVATYARQFGVAAEAAQLWVEADPDSPTPRQVIASVLSVQGRFDEMVPHVLKLLELDKPHLDDNLMRLNAMFVRQADRVAVLRFIEKVTAPYAAVAESHYALAVAARSAGALPRARAEIDRALDLRSDFDAAALLQAQLLARDSAGAASDGMQRYLEKNPKSREVRLQLARLLVAEKRYGDARREFERLLGDYPDSPEVVLPVAILALQQNDTGMAEKQLHRLLNLDFADKNLVHFYLGQIAAEDQRDGEALAHFAAVGVGEHYVAAQSRYAQVLARQGKIDEARSWLQQASAADAGERTQFVLSEAQILRDARRPADAYAVLDEALKKRPDDPDLLYDSALLSERLGRVDALEARLRRLIELKPDNAHAYNALGYSFADRNIRLSEARELIAKALELSPGDPFILDSMGWVLYRQGDLAAALQNLEKAYGIRSDAEIAAHLGEVLWMLERKDDARRVWREAAQRSPDNEALSAVVKKFAP